jgi:hypothetical protein
MKEQAVKMVAGGKKYQRTGSMVSSGTEEERTGSKNGRRQQRR